MESRELTNVRGERLGKVVAVLSHGDGQWARVKIGRLGRHKSIVPLDNASERDGKLCLPYETEHVQGAPDIDLEGDELSDEQVDLLCRHYGLERETIPSGIEDDDIELPREAREAKPPALDEGEDDLEERRRERADQLDLPDTSGEEPRSAEPTGPEPD